MIFLKFSQDFSLSQVETLLFKKAGNDYKKTPFHIGPDKFCDYLKNSVLYEDILKVSDLPPIGVCPWPKKKYTMQGFLIPLEKVPELAEGDFMTELRVVRNNELINGYQLFITIIRI